MRYDPLVVVVAVAVAACGGATRESPPAALTLQPCTSAAPPRADCGAFAVLENRGDPRGRVLSLNLVVLRAGDGKASEALVVLAGGPGQAATELTRLVLDNFAPMRTTRDIVLLDQRGAGQSHPLTCHLIDPASPASAFGAVFPRGAVEGCQRDLAARADLTQYTTATAVADLEELRAALGYERVVLFGGSYGTRVAQAYMKAHPSRVRAAVLDGVLPMDDGPLSYARSLQRAVDGVLGRCAARPDCGAAYPNLSREFADLIGRLRAGPMPATIRSAGGAVDVQMSLGDFAYSVRGILYTARGVAELPALIHTAAASGRLDAFAERYWQRALAFGRSFAHGLHLSVLCAEEIQGITEADVTTATAGTFMGRYLIEDYRRACASWPRAAVPASARTAVAVPVPVLLLSGEFDPSTPPQFAEKVAAALPNSRHIVVPDGAHGVLASCARAAALHVLTTGSVADVPEVCRGR